MADETVCKDAQNPICNEPVRAPDWSICLPFGARLYQQNGAIFYDQGSPPPDGSYAQIDILNGCIAGVQKGSIPVYTAAPCAPVPCPCGEPSNSIQEVPTQVYISAGTGISVVGSGTASNPFVISSTVQEQTRITVKGTGAIEVTGNTAYTVTHKSGLSGNIGGMKFDEYGHLVGYDTPTTSSYVKEVKGGEGIKVESEPLTGIVTVSLADISPDVVTGKFDVGTHHMEFDKGLLAKIEELSEDSYLLPTRHAYVFSSAALTPSMLGVNLHAVGYLLIEVRNAGGLPQGLGVSVDGAPQVVVRQSIPRGDQSSDSAVLVACFCLTAARYAIGSHIVALTTANAEDSIPAGTVVTVDVCEGVS